MSKILVTGGTGFVGSHLTEKLVALGHQVTILDNTEFGTLDNISSVVDKVNLVKGDLAQPDLVEKAVEGCEFIFHLAANNSVGRSVERPTWSAEQNIIGTVRLLETAVKHKIKRVVFSSSCTVYGDSEELPLRETTPAIPVSPYA
ncbi:MAG: GDP-mannose 4,6-dehydratase, partial [bacterium]